MNSSSPAMSWVAGRRWAWLALAALLLLAGAGVALLPIGAWLGAFERWIAGLGVWGIALFAAIYIVAALFLAPEWPLSVAAGLAYGIWGVPLVVVAATIAAAASFLVARHAVRDRVRALFSRRRRLAAIDAAIAEEGWKIVALLRLSPVLPFSLQSYLFGATAISFREFVAATSMGIVPCTALYVYVGVLGRAVGSGERALGLLEWLYIAAGLAATVVGFGLVTRKAMAKLRAAGLAERSR